MYKDTVTQESLRLIIVSNRLPSIVEKAGGTWRVRPASGGLVSAVAPVLRDRGGTWIGWAGTVEEDNVDVDSLLEEAGRDTGYELKPVTFSRLERDRFYAGFSNEVIWPLFHSLDERCNFDPAYWTAYETVNRKFAQVVHRTADGGGNFLWVHDYHLMPLGDELRALGVEDRIGFFLHIPFPSLDIFLKLPWRFQLLRSMFAYDILGFQTLRDRRNFVQCVRALQRDATVSGRGRIQTITTATRSVLVGTFPISIDFADFAKEADTPEVAELIARLQGELQDRKMLLGLDRLDYTKGIPTRLRAFRRLLQRFPELRRKVRLVQVVVPSRENIPSYQRMKEEIDELVGEINGEYSEPGWVPVHYTFRFLNRTELAAYYRAAAVALVTPLNDGMNLVAKEYCACNVDETGVLILSEFAGAASELHRGALLVNPYDIEGMADAIWRALTMHEKERASRMGRLRRIIKQNDIKRWVNLFLEASVGEARDEADPNEGAGAVDPTDGTVKSKAVNLVAPLPPSLDQDEHAFEPLPPISAENESGMIRPTT